MEEAKADDLFRLFTKVDAAAKQKKVNFKIYQTESVFGALEDADKTCM